MTEVFGRNPHFTVFFAGKNWKIGKQKIREKSERKIEILRSRYPHKGSRAGGGFHDTVKKKVNAGILGGRGIVKGVGSSKVQDR